MDAVALLRTLREAGCELQAEGDRLRVNAPKGVLTDELRSLIRQHKPELLRLLAPVKASRIEESATLPLSGVTFALSLRRDGTCYVCGGSRWWLSVYGVLVCCLCHPPPAPELVSRYLTGEEAANLVL